MTAWDAPADGATANTGAINFPQATASWGTVTSVGVKDSCSSTGADNLLLYGDLDTPKAVTTDDTFTIPAGDLDVTLA